MSSAEEWFDRYREDVASELVMHCPDPVSEGSDGE